MTTILVLHDDRSVDEHEFDADVRTVTIGRRPSNDVCIQDRSVSGTHARLEVRDDGTWLEDLGSTNGTWLGGDGVSRRRLEDGDEVLVGKVRLKVHVLDPWAEATSAAQAAAERTASAAPATAAHASVSAGGDADEDSFVERSLVTSAPDGDDDELDEDMRRALELYSDDEDEDEPVARAAGPAPAGFDRDDDDEPDFAEDARLFARPVTREADDDAAGVNEHDPHDEHREHAASGAGEPEPERDMEAAQDRVADDSLSLTDRAKVALARQQPARPQLRAVDSGSARDARTPDFDDADDPDDGEETQVEHVPSGASAEASRASPAVRPADTSPDARERRPLARDDAPPAPTHELDRPSQRSRGAVIQIKNGAKSGQILPIDKPVTTLGRPGIQIAAIMRKPDGYFLMHIESDDAVDRPTLNSDSIGDEPVLLHSGDELNVAGIDVEFMLS